MAEYLFFHHTASEQRSSVRLSARFVLAVNEPIRMSAQVRYAAGIDSGMVVTSW